ncbi:3-methyl-2-oxobutanoate hydroxymethyltransferase [Pseudokineococcus marinus]|uniref:3-methyl-2-oxobutanoate hydroxymethyltransferase n=1 Tax=Pseudokineococcus marinus TaxID=351215 RepID=A0A849BQG0_9ACTN|nr:3-methyl-2-oxobutanoate hydroxymethyltransferase [Pseudokineococcus marinus]NNH23227.1 3-methyl-2-oxobutanoate hydroxymethyltransferase [Pseudokineococcus marinus]
MSEQPAPYGSPPTTPGGPPAAPARTPRVVRTTTLQGWKAEGRRWAMLTAYDALTASALDDAGVPVLLVGDSAGTTVLGQTSTLAVTVEEMLVLTRAVVRGTARALVVADLPFGSYQEGPAQALATGVRMLKEGGAAAVKLEGGAAVAPSVRALVDAGVPVMGHVGFTPQSEHALGGYRVQGRGDDADRLLADALALQDAGAFAVVVEMVPSAVAERLARELAVPVVGIGAGPGADAQVLVVTDMAGLGGGRTPRFVKRYADLRGELGRAAAAFAADVEDGSFPAAEHEFTD